ncbi:LURP-one-related/scramblase family protein [Clostridium niameyense]|uniref:LURP-one-related/scramblase family protein n=1 Tax=Clostridium niameyense TaxID=1622073 RepID=UPI00067E9A03|nr:LURP-one-related family protein [Clostridium niameyense]
MKFIIKQKLFSIRDKYIVENEEGQKLYKVEGSLMSLGKKFRMYDTYDREVVYIKEKIIKIVPKYYININGNDVAIVKKQVSFIKPVFLVESVIGNYEVKGDIFHYNFYIQKQGKKIAIVKKRLLSIKDCYEVNIKDGESQILILAIVIIIDEVIHNNKNKEED